MEYDGFNVSKWTSYELKECLNKLKELGFSYTIGAENIIHVYRSVFENFL